MRRPGSCASVSTPCIWCRGGADRRRGAHVPRRGPLRAVGIRGRHARPPCWRFASPALARVNVVVIMTDDQTAASLAVHAEREHAAGRRGHDVRPGDRQLPALLPVARHEPHRPVRPQPRRAPQRPAVRRLHPARRHEHAAGLAPGRRLPHDARGPLPERLRGEVRHPAGLDRLGRPAALGRVQLLRLEGLRPRRREGLSRRRPPGRVPDRLRDAQGRAS